MEDIKYSRIAFLGPAPPFRGGIAQFAVHLAKVLASRGARIMFCNFTQQYPQLLFPGGSQYDNSVAPPDMINKRCFSAYLPWTWHKAVRELRDFSPDMLIVSYWLPFFAPSLAWIASKMKQTKVVFLAHNIQSHEYWPFMSKLRNYALGKAEHIVLLSQACLNDIYKYCPNQIARRAVLGFHPIYNHGTPIDYTGLSEQKRILFFGLIKPYKGLDILLEAMPSVLRVIPELKLIIAGAVYGKQQTYEDQIDRLGIRESVETDFRYINEDEMAGYFGKCQACILPYRSATQSGVIADSYSFGIPVIAFNVGGLAEYIQDGETGLLVSEVNKEALAKAIISFYQEYSLDRMQHHIYQYVQMHSWDKLADLIWEL